MGPWIFALVLAVAAVDADEVELAAARSAAAVDELMAHATVPAVSVAVGIEDQVVWAGAFGLASLADSTTATTETRFGIGSITKSLTLVLVARLVDRGILDWDRPLTTWIRDFPSQQMTLRHIGAHQSGLNDDLVSSLRFTLRHFDTAEAYEAVITAPPDFSPGEQVRYATGSFNVIARLVEVVTGEPFATVLQREVLDPAGMAATVINDPRQPMPARTSFHDPQDGQLVEVEFDPSVKLAGAGYLSTPSDLVRFGLALMNGSLCSQEQLRELFRLHEGPPGSTSDFGLGWRITEDQGMLACYQPGGGPGISAYLVLYPERRLAFAILANETAAAVGGEVMGKTLDAFLGLAAAD